MCTSLLAPKPPSMPAAPAPVMAQDAIAAEEAKNPEPIFNPGSEQDDMGMASTASKQKQGKASLKTHDTGLAIPL